MDRSELYRIREKLSRELPEKRYQHSLGVEFTAAALAMRYEADIEKAELAGLIHDCAKVIHNETKVAHAEHAPEIAESMYDVHDPEVLSAIRWHTTGKADMTVLEKIIYVADFIEPCRKPFPELPEARKLAFTDLTATVYYIADRTIRYLKELGVDIDPKTMECLTYLKENGTHD
jgi:putative nucleotidyltransferase with HDIG domain